MGRILMVARPSKGGAFGHTARLGSALVERGHDVALCGPHAAHAETLGLEVFDVQIGREPTVAARALAGVADAVSSFEADVVHAHGSQGGALARLARPAYPRVPVVFTPHNYAFANYFAGGWQRTAFRGIETALAPLATRVICCCEAERRLACKVGPNARTRVVYNGLEPTGPPPADARLAEVAADGPLVICVAELHPRKGIPTLLEAVPAVVERHRTATIAVAGAGPQRAEIERMIAERDIGERVSLLGEVGDVSAALAAADAFVLPSWSEAFPYAILEAMRARLPIVATEVGGVGEAVENHVTGRLVAPHDAPALASALIDVLDDPVAADTLAAAAEARFRERFTFDRMVSGTLDVYHELGAR